MSKVYIIEIDDSDIYDESHYTYSKAFTSKDKAEEFLLEHFNKHELNDGRVYYSLKYGHSYKSDFHEGNSAVITELELL